MFMLILLSSKRERARSRNRGWEKERNWERESKTERKRDRLRAKYSHYSTGSQIQKIRERKNWNKQTQSKGWRVILKKMAKRLCERNTYKSLLFNKTREKQVCDRAKEQFEKWTVIYLFARKQGPYCSEKVKKRGVIMANIQVWGIETLHTTDWLMCVCRADMGNVIVAFISRSGLPPYSKKAIQGHFVLLTMRVAVTCQCWCVSLHVSAWSLQYMPLHSFADVEKAYAVKLLAYFDLLVLSCDRDHSDLLGV